MYEIGGIFESYMESYYQPTYFMILGFEDTDIQEIKENLKYHSYELYYSSLSFVEFKKLMFLNGFNTVCAILNETAPKNNVKEQFLLGNICTISTYEQNYFMCDDIKKIGHLDIDNTYVLKLVMQLGACGFKFLTQQEALSQLDVLQKFYTRKKKNVTLTESKQLQEFLNVHNMSCDYYVGKKGNAYSIFYIDKSCAYPLLENMTLKELIFFVFKVRKNLEDIRNYTSVVKWSIFMPVNDLYTNYKVFSLFL